MTDIFKTMDQALPGMAAKILTDGEEVGSRLGERTFELLHQQIIIEEPWRREILTPGRKANVVAQIAETMWVLAGRNDVEWLSHYLQRAKDFSDDGKTWRGGYGPRLRAWFQNAYDGRFDQVKHVIDVLHSDRTSRRAVMSIYDPAIDTQPGKDIPCNDFLSFINRDGYLHMSVFVRSNDLIWGWSGINAFEWSALQEIIAGILGVRVGVLVFNTTSLHVYDRHWTKADRLAGLIGFEAGWGDSARFDGSVVHNYPNEPKHPVEALDQIIGEWFRLEERIRTGEKFSVDAFPEPMLQSWLRVIAWYWTGDPQHLIPLEGTRLAAAVGQVPTSVKMQAAGRSMQRSVLPFPKSMEVAARAAMEAEQQVSEMLQPGTDLYAIQGEKKVGAEVTVTPVKVVPPLLYKPAFMEYVDNLHREKGAAYGDSWKKRGEQMSILANIARKVDRLEGGGRTDDETSADTAIDLLVYLIKYRLWLSDQHGDGGHVFYRSDMDEYDGLASVLYNLDRVSGKQMQHAAIPRRIQAILEFFRALEQVVDLDPHRENPMDRMRIVENMLLHAFPLARRLWEEENGYVAADEDRLDLISEGKMPTLPMVRLASAVKKEDAERAVAPLKAQQNQDVEKIKEVADKLKGHAERNANRRWGGYDE